MPDLKTQFKSWLPKVEPAGAGYKVETDREPCCGYFVPVRLAPSESPKPTENWFIESRKIVAQQSFVSPKQGPTRWISTLNPPHDRAWRGQCDGVVVVLIGIGRRDLFWQPIRTSVTAGPDSPLMVTGVANPLQTAMHEVLMNSGKWDLDNATIAW